jgi:prevent-host-death family protein
MSVVTIHQAKTNLPRLIAKASEGEEVIIARGSEPVARIVPVGEVKGKRQPGSLKASCVLDLSFLSPSRSANLLPGSSTLARTTRYACLLR